VTKQIMRYIILQKKSLSVIYGTRWNFWVMWYNSLNFRENFPTFPLYTRKEELLGKVWRKFSTSSCWTPNPKWVSVEVEWTKQSKGPWDVNPSGHHMYYKCISIVNKNWTAWFIFPIFLAPHVCLTWYQSHDVWPV